MRKVPGGMREFLKRSRRFSNESVRFRDAYDILDARWPDYGIVARSKELLKTVGASGKEVWSAEIYSDFPLAEPLVLPNWTLHAWPMPSKSREYLRILKNPRHPMFAQINGWYRGWQAAQVVKTSMVALDAGAKKLMMGWATDLQTPFAMSKAAQNGLYSITLKKFWPAAHTYGLMIRKLGGFRAIRRLPMPEDVYVYECACRGARRVLVAFHDDHIAQNHDDPPADIQVAIPWSAKRVRITDIITKIDQTRPESRDQDLIDGTLRIKLTEFPVFIEALGNR